MFGFFVVFVIYGMAIVRIYNNCAYDQYVCRSALPYILYVL